MKEEEEGSGRRGRASRNIEEFNAFFYRNSKSHREIERKRQTDKHTECRERRERREREEILRETERKGGGKEKEKREKRKERYVRERETV